MPRGLLRPLASSQLVSKGKAAHILFISFVFIDGHRPITGLLISHSLVIPTTDQNKKLT
jgi:hypothetical protein